MIEVLSLFTGIFWKIYDDYADNKEAYSFLSKVEFPLEVVLILSSLLFAFFDNFFLFYLFMIIVLDCILYIIKENNEEVKVNYAIDTDVWKLGAIFAYGLFIFRFPSMITNFTQSDSILISVALVSIVAEIVSQCTKDQKIIKDETENHLFLEASNQKLVTRVIELVLFLLFFAYILPPHFTSVALFAISYISASIFSILYLKYYYFYRQGKPMFEK